MMPDQIIDRRTVAIPGPQGTAAGIAGASVETLAADQTATVTVSGPDTGRTFAFHLPRGLPGVNAAANDEAMATLVAAADSDTGAALRNQFEQVVTPIDGENPVDTTVRINAALAAGSVRLRGEFTIKGPIVLRSGNALDARGASITNDASSIVQMVVNAGSVAVATGTGSVDAGSTTLTTSMTLTVGQTVTVAGADASGTTVLTADVTAVGDGAVTLSVPALSAVSGGAVKAFNRDHDITLTGGRWDRGTNTGGGGIALHNVYIRHADGVTVDIESVHSSHGKYAVSVASASRVWVRARGLDAHSDGVHLMGPLDCVHVDLVEGTTVDDCLAITAADWAAYGDSSGDVRHVTVGSVHCDSAGANLIKVLAGAGTTVDDVKVLGTVSGTAALNVAWIGDDTAQESTTGGAYGCIDLGTLSGKPGSNSAALDLRSVNGAAVTARLDVSGTCKNAVRIEGANTSTLHDLHISGTVDASDITENTVISASQGVTVERLTLDHAIVLDATTAVLNVTNGALGTIVFTAPRIVLPSNQSVNVATFSGGSVSALQFLGGEITNGKSTLYQTAGNTLAFAVQGTRLVNVQRLLDCRAGTVTMNVQIFDSTTQESVHIDNDANVTLAGDSAVPSLGFHGAPSATGKIRAITSTFTCALTTSILAHNAGDRVWANSMSGFAEGPSICDGTTWHNLATGQAYTP
jgi:hypothetical protein